jgi:aminoglycoside phosphotransferase
MWHAAGWTTSMPTVGAAKSLIGVSWSIGRWRLLRMVSMRAGCCTSLLYWTTGASNNIVKAALTSVREGAPVEIMAHGYTNSTARSGQVVTKTYQGPDAVLRQHREATALAALAGCLPVPALISTDDASLSMNLMPGVHGQDLIDQGMAHRVLTACGQMLRRVHAIDPLLIQAGDLDVPGTVLVHGDYGPNNTLLDAKAQEVTAIVDWEWVHAGDSVEDLAWCEWIVRMHHAEHVDALSAFFDAYQCRPSWAARWEAMLARCQEMLELCERWSPGGQGVDRWRQRLMITESWTE